LGDGSAASRLRLSSARRRIDAFIEQIDVLAASSFPHDDGKQALAAIRTHCQELRGRLDVHAGVRDDVIDRLCLSLLDDVANFTEILGFILRSTNVRNPFELHFIVKKLIAKALGEEVNLLISSEWAYEPFTYPMNIDQLPEFILIGTPAPESSNPLLIPLAGHEVGHSAWRMYECTLKYSSLANDQVALELQANETAAKDLQETAPLKALDRDRVINHCAADVMRQLEEIYCDLFGLYLFGHSFIAAFDYLLGPGFYDRVLEYPTDWRRIQILVEAADILEIEYDRAMTDHWTAALPRRADRAAAQIVDAATSALVPLIRDDLFKQLQACGITTLRQDVINQVKASFDRSEPYPERVELGEIISAGWLRLRELDEAEIEREEGEDDEDIEKKRSKSYKVLADLVLKTVEVAEYHDRVGDHA
jgi:hypothetical protein